MLIYTTEEGNLKYEQIIQTDIDMNISEAKENFIKYIESDSKFTEIKNISRVKKGCVIKCVVNIKCDSDTKSLKIRFELNNIGSDEIKLIGVLSNKEYKNEFKPVIDKAYTEIENRF